MEQKPDKNDFLAQIGLVMLTTGNAIMMVGCAVVVIVGVVILFIILFG